MRFKQILAVAASVLLLGGALASAQTIDLPSSKQLIGEIPGHPQRLNSLPISMAISPDGRYVVTVNAGYGTFESQYLQSLAVLDTTTGALSDFPDARTPVQGMQTLYSGLAFSRDGKHIYASMASLFGSQRKYRRRHGQRHRGLSLHGGKRRAYDRARAADSFAGGATCQGAHNKAARRIGHGSGRAVSGCD